MEEVTERDISTARKVVCKKHNLEMELCETHVSHGWWIFSVEESEYIFTCPKCFGRYFTRVKANSFTYLERELAKCALTKRAADSSQAGEILPAIIVEVKDFMLA